MSQKEKEHICRRDKKKSERMKRKHKNSKRMFANEAVPKWYIQQRSQGVNICGIEDL